MTENNDKDTTPTASTKPRPTGRPKRTSRRVINTKGAAVKRPSIDQNDAPPKAESAPKAPESESTVIITSKHDSVSHPEKYESDGAPLMTFRKSDDTQSLSDAFDRPAYKKVAKPIETRLPSELYQEYHAKELDGRTDAVIYEGQLYTIKNEFFAQFLKKAEDSLYSNYSSRNWARKVALSELKNDHQIEIDDYRLITIPGDLRIQGNIIDLPDYNQKGLEKSVKSTVSDFNM